MKEGKEQEKTCCHIASHRPRIAYLPEIDLECAYKEDEGSIGEDDCRLRTDMLGDSQQALDGRAQHLLIVHAGSQFVPSTKQAYHQQGKEDR